MNTKNLKRTVVLLMCIFITACSTLAAFAAETYTVTELDDMVITLPDGMSAITRSSKSSDKYFSVFGIDYSTTMQTFKNSDIYLQGMDDLSAVTVTVTMTKTDESQKIGNYTKLNGDELTKIRNNFLNMGEYGSCTPDQSEKFIWLIFDATVSSGGNKIKAYQANTVYDGMSINITMKRNEGDVTPADYASFTQIVSSADFLKGDLTTNILPYIIIGGTVVIVLLIVLIIVFASRAKKHKKHHQNKAILQELADKYNLSEKNERDNNGYDLVSFDDSQADEESAEVEIIADSRAYGEPAKEEYDEYFEDTDGRYVSDDEIDDIISSARAYKNPPQAVVENKPDETAQEAYEGAENSDEPEQYSDGAVDENGAKTENPEQTEQAGDFYADVLFGRDDPDEDDIFSDEELVRQQVKHTKFDSGYDFFEEAPKKTMGVISSQEIRDAEDYDVINEVEQKAIKVQNEGVKKPNPVLVFFVGAGKGLKSFGVHFGYFCKNISIMIKRKRAAAKRRKAEQERRERERARAERARQRAARGEADNGLVRVHSRSEQRPPQRRRPPNK